MILCFGWIDGCARHDETVYTVRLRHENQGAFGGDQHQNVEAPIEKGRMQLAD
jgi:hypothetical protein